MMLLLNKDSTQENLENLKPGISYQVTAAPPTTCLFSSMRTLFPALAKQLAATSPLCPAPTIMASQVCFPLITSQGYYQWTRSKTQYLIRIQGLMSSKSTLTRVGGFLRRMKVRMANFVHYKVLSNKKSLLMLGGDDHPEFRSNLINRYSSNWKITSVAATQAKADLYVPLTEFTAEQYKNIEKLASDFTKLYDSIVVLPSKLQDTSLEDPEILDRYFSKHPNKVQLSLLAYKLASKMLTPNGVVILTGSEKAFFGEKGVDAVNSIQSMQCSCLNTVIGERDYTDVNSYSLLALTDDFNLDDQQQAKHIIDLIKSWSEGSQLPYPGSFAKILKKNSVYFPQFF